MYKDVHFLLVLYHRLADFVRVGFYLTAMGTKDTTIFLKT